MPPNPEYVADPLQIEIFAALTQMTRNFVKLVGMPSRNSQVLARLDDCLKKGWVLRTQFAIGRAGALDWRLAAISPIGEVVEIASLDAPPSYEEFRLDNIAAKQ